MKYKVWYFSPELEASKLGWGATHEFVFAKDADEAVGIFYDTYDWDLYPVSHVEEVSQYIYHGNEDFRRRPGKVESYTMDPLNPWFDEFYIFDGIVNHADPVVWFKADETRFVWNGRFDW